MVCVYAVLDNYKVEMMLKVTQMNFNVIQMALQATTTHSQKIVVRICGVEKQSMILYMYGITANVMNGIKWTYALSLNFLQNNILISIQCIKCAIQIVLIQSQLQLFSSTLTRSQCDAGNITFLWFLLFLMCKSLNAAVNECINCCFVHLLL